MFGREEVCRYLAWEPMDIDQARAKLEQRLGQGHLDDDRQGSCCGGRGGHRAYVGEFMLRIASVVDRQGEVGWSLDPDVQAAAWRRKVPARCCAWGSTSWGSTGSTRSATTGTASLRLMDRLGMRREALFVDAELSKGEWIRMVVAAILEDDRAQATPTARAGRSARSRSG